MEEYGYFTTPEFRARAQAQLEIEAAGKPVFEAYLAARNHIMGPPSSGVFDYSEASPWSSAAA